MIDLHIHTNASDGTDSVQELLDKVGKLEFFSVTDHDTVDGALEMDDLVVPGTGYVRGIEFSCVSPAGECHILGYGYDPEDPVFQAALEEGRQLRYEKLLRRLAFLEEHFGIVLTEQELAWLYSQKSPGKPHLGRILADRGLAEDPDKAIKKYVSPCKGGREKIDAETAVRAILHAGGIPVWAHPLGGEGEVRLKEADFESLLQELMGYGIRGLECFYSRYVMGDIEFLQRRARANGLLVSGGSDYHGDNKANIELGKLNTDNTPVDPKELTILTVLQ